MGNHADAARMVLVAGSWRVFPAFEGPTSCRAEQNLCMGAYADPLFCLHSRNVRYCSDRHPEWRGPLISVATCDSAAQFRSEGTMQMQHAWSSLPALGAFSQHLRDRPHAEQNKIFAWAHMPTHCGVCAAGMCAIAQIATQSGEDLSSRLQHVTVQLSSEVKAPCRCSTHGPRCRLLARFPSI